MKDTYKMSKWLGMDWYSINDTPNTQYLSVIMGNAIQGLEFVNVSWTGMGWRGQVQFPVLDNNMFRNSGYVTLEPGDVTEHKG